MYPSSRESTATPEFDLGQRIYRIGGCRRQKEKGKSLLTVRKGGAPERVKV